MECQKSMSDFKKPDEKNPWCPKCHAHTEFMEEEVHWTHDNQSCSRTIWHCADCSKKMKIPWIEKRKFVSFTIGWVFISIGGCFLIRYLAQELPSGDEASEENIGLMIAWAPVVFVSLWFLISFSNLLFYLKWKRWTRELR